MQRHEDSVNLMTFIRPHQSGFLLSIILAVISVTSGIVPYFAVARIVNLLIGGETNFSAYLTWGIVALIAYLMKSVFHGLSTRCSHETTFHVLSEIRQAVADKLTARFYGIFDGYTFGTAENNNGRASGTNGSPSGAHHPGDDL